MFLAIGLGFALLVGATWGYAQWAMDVTPWAWLSLPLGAVFGGGLYFVSLTGQRLGASQIDHLESALTELVVEPPHSGRESEIPN
jgi:hypothetical protein